MEMPDLINVYAALDIDGISGEPSMFDVIATFIVGFAAVLAALAVILKFFFKAPLNMWFAAKQFFDDWNGEPSRDGYDARPGMKHRVQTMEKNQENIQDSLNTHIEDETARLNKVDARLDQVDMKVTKVTDQIGKELTLNGGSSTKDAAHEALRIVQNIAPIIDQIQAQQQADYVMREQWHARYLKELEQIKKDRSTVLLGIKDMIGKTPEEQAEIWDNLTTPYVVSDEKDNPNI